MEPIVVEVTRGEVVEARHVVHAVAVRDGRVELAAGDAALVTYLRSSAKPIQALPVVRARPDLDDEEIALACASHLAAPEQLAVVRRLLSDAPAVEDELECGGAPTPIEHNCSGKHAGFLALCRARDWPTPGYRLLEHPCQQAMLREVAEAAEVEPSSLAVGVDGCGVPTFALPLERAAHCFARLASLDGGERVVRAMRAHPDLLRGPVATRRAADPRTRRMGREGRRRRALLRRLGGRPRARAQGASTARFARSSPRSRTCSPCSGSTRARWARSPVSNSLGEQRRRAARPLRGFDR